MQNLLKTSAKELLSRLHRVGATFTVMDTVAALKEEYDNYVLNEYYREKIERTAEDVGSGLWVGGESDVNSATVLGDNVHFLGMHVHGEGRVSIGDNFHSGSGCQLITENHNYDTGDAIPYDGTYTYGPVEIGDNVWFGRNVTVLPSVSVGEGAIIQTGSVVTKDVPKGAIAGGHPAEVFDYRDMEHYEKLKAEGKFY